jgi:DNA-directed RNA polymerase specialized sigma subunit
MSFSEIGLSADQIAVMSLIYDQYLTLGEAADRLGMSVSQTSELHRSALDVIDGSPN